MAWSGNCRLHSGFPTEIPGARRVGVAKRNQPHLPFLGLTLVRFGDEDTLHHLFVDLFARPRHLRVAQNAHVIPFRVAFDEDVFAPVEKYDVDTGGLCISAS